MALRLLLIEDDDAVASEIVTQLAGKGHTVDRLAEVSTTLLEGSANPYDVIIVDRMLPGGDGLDIVQAFRAGNDATPVLVLSALGNVSDRVAGLRSGADDYLVKPFSVDELEARVEALARRGGARPTRIAIGDLVIDRLARTVQRGATPITLMPREYSLLEMLMLSSPSVVTRTMLLQAVWGIRFDPGTNLIESHMSRLRGKIDRGGDPPIIHTIRGEGYVAQAR